MDDLGSALEGGTVAVAGTGAVVGTGADAVVGTGTGTVVETGTGTMGCISDIVDNKHTIINISEPINNNSTLGMLL